MLGAALWLGLLRMAVGEPAPLFHVRSLVLTNEPRKLDTDGGNRGGAVDGAGARLLLGGGSQGDV